MGKNRGKATKIDHITAAAEPKAKALIEELAENFENWSREVRCKKLKALLAIDGISGRGLARDTGISDSTLRNYVDSTVPAKKIEVSRKQAPLAAAPLPPVVQQQLSAAKQVVRTKVVLPPRPDFDALRRARETKSRELTLLLLEFLQRRGASLGFRYPLDIPLVLRDVQSLMSDLPDSSSHPMVSLPMGDARSDFFNGISLGAMDCDRLYQLAVGLRNVMMQLGGNKSTWEDAITELRRISKELAGEGTSQQQTSLPREQPIKRTAEIRWLPGWGLRPNGR